MIHKITRVFDNTNNYKQYQPSKILYTYESEFQKKGILPCIFFWYCNITTPQYSFGITSAYKRDGNYSFVQTAIRTINWDGVYIDIL